MTNLTIGSEGRAGGGETGEDEKEEPVLSGAGAGGSDAW